MWLITGGDGQLAKAISKELTERNASFIALDKLKLDITDYANVDLIIDKYRPEVIVNCAAWTDVDGCEDDQSSAYLINSEAVSNLALKCATLGIKLIHISSDYVFSGQKDSPWKTTDPTSPGTIYGKSKARAEKYIEELGNLEYLIVRSSWIYSQWGVNFPKKIIKRILNGNYEFKIVSDQIGQPTNAKDLASVIVDLNEKQISGKVLHASNSGSTNWFEFSKLIANKFKNLDIRIEPISTLQLNNPIARPKYSVLDCLQLSDLGINLLPEWDVSFSNEFENILNQCQKELYAK
jgi:dTDP-4-dehydrorhamnose reductase